MNYNLKIIFSLTIVFILSFSILITFLTISAPKLEINESQQEFYSKDFSSELDRIFIIGSSQTASLNATYIENKINKNNQNYEVYNLSIKADRPLTRLQTLDQLILTKPTLVIIGVGFFEFENLKKPLIIKPKIECPPLTRKFVLYYVMLKVMICWRNVNCNTFVFTLNDSS